MPIQSELVGLVYLRDTSPLARTYLVRSDPSHNGADPFWNGSDPFRKELELFQTGSDLPVPVLEPLWTGSEQEVNRLRSAAVKAGTHEQYHFAMR